MVFPPWFCNRFATTMMVGTHVCFSSNFAIGVATADCNNLEHNLSRSCNSACNRPRHAEVPACYLSARQTILQRPSCSSKTDTGVTIHQSVMVRTARTAPGPQPSEYLTGQPQFSWPHDSSPAVSVLPQRRHPMAQFGFWCAKAEVVFVGVTNTPSGNPSKLHRLSKFSSHHKHCYRL